MKVIQVRIVKIKSFILQNKYTNKISRVWEVFGVDWRRKKGRKENHSEGKSPSLYILLPLLLTNPKPSITFRDLLLISNIFAKFLLIIKMTNILRNPFCFSHR